MENIVVHSFFLLKMSTYGSYPPRSYTSSQQIVKFDLRVGSYWTNIFFWFDQLVEKLKCFESISSLK